MISASRDRVSVVFDFAVGDNRYRIVRIMQRSGSHRVQLEKHDGKDFSINLADQVRNVDEKVLERPPRESRIKLVGATRTSTRGAANSDC